MNELDFTYQFGNDAVVFTDTLTESSPYISFKPRNHESIFFVNKGALLYEKDEEKAVIKEGEVGYIARGSVDKSSACLCPSVSYIAINFSFDHKDLTKTLPFDTLCSSGVAYKYERLFTELYENFAYRSPGYRQVCNGLIAQIIGYLYNEYRIGKVNFKKTQKINDSLKYLQSNYMDQELTVWHLAEISDMSEKQFRRIFFDVYKKNPYVFLQEFRIDKAKILLLHTKKNVTEIALQCGFSDVYSFSHCFKKHTGASPTEYRSNCDYFIA